MFYQLECRGRGYFQIGPLVLETGDLFGLHRRYQVGTSPHFVLVYPEVVALEGYDIASRRPIGEVRMMHRLFEDPTRIAGVRAYEAGDPLNRVHWRATARTGKLHSKIYEPSSITGATIVMEFNQAAFDPRHEPVRSELAVTAAASLANLELLADPARQAAIHRVGSTLQESLRGLWRLPNVGDIRQEGCVAGIELVCDWRTRKPFDMRKRVGARVTEAMARRGVLTRPVGDVIVLMPPFCSTQRQTQTVTTSIC